MGDFTDKKISIVGIGAIGGYVGGALAKKYPHVSFIARGARKEAILEKGLIVKSEYMGDYLVMPEKVTDKPEELGIMDYIFVCVKNYSLEQVCKQILPMVGPDTVIIPVMNGTNPSERTRNYLGQGIVLDSLIYVVAGSTKDFTIVQNGKYANIHIGLKNPGEKEKEIIEHVNEFINAAGVECIIEADIEAAIWRKYVLNCAYNVITAYYNTTTGVLRQDPKKIEEFRSLLYEACLVGRTKGVYLPEGLEEEHYHHFLYEHADNATSSLRRDMDAGNPNELETFSGYLLEIGKQLGLELAFTEKFYKELKIR
ncbi:MAG: 2-dehydropantoate 2-reductase [Anaerocolumna sp.]|jgi:2-dehydropantoate 2-reductase|nr:2-dehydropantoate 2-reductase [Anaerocolumna sp.]